MKKAHVKTLEKALKQECKRQGRMYAKGMLRKAKKMFHTDPEVKAQVLSKKNI